MASAKRKQDEKNLKLLRELVSQPGNKECFDCRQRGPTYVNMTIGSFVCTSCSGILRGLTPPHRVKSISMATFTQDDVEFIQKQGNDHCRRIWLGLADPPTPKILDSKDEQKMKDLMISKYELKRFYLDPLILSRTRIHKSSTTTNNAQTNQTAIPRVPRSYTTMPASSSLQRMRHPDPVYYTDSFDMDFVADFDQVPDLFSAATPTPQLNQAFTPQPSFANFDNNPVFSSPKSMDFSFSDEATGSFANFNGINKPPSEDRYAALKDLDSLMKQTHLNEEPMIPPTSNWESNNLSGTNHVWNGDNQTTNVISNPFTAADVWQPVANLVNNNNDNTQSADNACNSANPFRAMQLPANNEHQWFGVGSSGNGDVVSSSQSMTAFSSKAWQPTVTSFHANPFMVGSGVGTTARNTNNPFL